jgi:hypothetical protein
MCTCSAAGPLPVVVALPLVPVVAGIMMTMHGCNHWRGGGAHRGTARWDGYEYVLTLAVVSLRLAALGPGRYSLDNALRSETSGWAGGCIARGAAVVATAGMLAAFWRSGAGEDAGSRGGGPGASVIGPTPRGP